MFKRQVVKDLGRPTALLAFAAAGPGLGLAAGLGLAVANAEALRGGGLAIALLLIVVGFLGCGLWLLPTHLLSLVCGWALGWPAGVAVALGTATAAAPLGYGVGGKLAGGGALAWAQRYPKGAAVCRAITRSSSWRAGYLVGLLRLSPVVPYGATNVLAAAFRVRMGAFILGTAVGLAPRVAAVAGLGAGLEQLEMTKPGGWGWLVVGVAATALMIVSLGWVTRGALRRAAAAGDEDVESPSNAERALNSPITPGSPPEAPRKPPPRPDDLAARYTRRMASFHHTVHFWLRHELSDERRAAFFQGLSKVADSPNVKSCRVGVPAGTDRPVVDNSFDAQLHCVFESKEKHDAYQSADDAVHTAFIEGFKDCWARVLIYDSVEA